MIQNRTAADRTVEGNLTGEDIKMGVADMAHILNVVTDLYSDREKAPIREYSTNALDAHIEAGVNAPIEVTTPSPLSPFLTIRDFGVGLDLEDIRTIYSQYGASTKRNTNSQTGMLGLGCKSALTYADQFTVTSVKNGVRIQVVVSRNTQGASMKVVDTSDTSDPNGTAVMIPARSSNHIDQKAKEFFNFWRPGTVKLNGVEPKFMDGYKRVTDSLYLKSDGYGSQSYIVMGGVPYPADIEHGLGYGKAVVAFVGIGEVDFAPSRESLMNTDTTQLTLRNVARALQTALRKSIEDDIASAATHAEAAKKCLEWGRQVPRQFMPAQATFHGSLVPDSYKVENDLIVAAQYASKMSAHSNYQTGGYLPIPSVNGSLWVTGFDYVSFTATVRKKLEKYCEDNGLTPTNYILWQSTVKPDQTWIEGIHFVDWPTVKAIKLPKNAVNTRTGRIPGSYDIYQADDGYLHGVPGDDIDQESAIFWMLGSRYTSHASLIHNRLLQSYPDCTLVLLRSGREAKFQRLFPESKEATAVLNDAYTTWKDGIDKDDAYAYMMAQSADRRLEELDASRLDDPEIKRIKKIIGRDVSKLRSEANEWQKLGYYWSPEERKDVSDPLTKYVLLPDSYYFSRQIKRHADHIYSYMNNAYANLQEDA